MEDLSIDLQAGVGLLEVGFDDIREFDPTMVRSVQTRIAHAFGTGLQQQEWPSLVHQQQQQQQGDLS